MILRSLFALLLFIAILPVGCSNGGDPNGDPTSSTGPEAPSEGVPPQASNERDDGPETPGEVRAMPTPTVDPRAQLATRVAHILPINDPANRDFPTVSFRDRDNKAILDISCGTHAQGLHVSLTQMRTRKAHSNARITFRSGDKDLRTMLLPLGLPKRFKRPSLYEAERVGYLLGDHSQEVIDGLLLKEVSAMVVHFGADSSGSTVYDRTVHEFGIERFFIVSELLAQYCRETAVTEAQSTLAAQALAVPTPTPAPPPTFTPAPPVPWQQEWCRDHDDPYFDIGGAWHPRSGAEGTVRLIARCSGGLLVMGIHITRSDDTYPENKIGIAIAVRRGDDVEFYRHYQEGWEHVRGESVGGLFIILPDAAAEDVIKLISSPQFQGKQDAELLVIFHAIPGNAVGPETVQEANIDVVIPLRELAVRR